MNPGQDSFKLAFVQAPSCLSISTYCIYQSHQSIVDYWTTLDHRVQVISYACNATYAYSYDACSLSATHVGVNHEFCPVAFLSPERARFCILPVRSCSSFASQSLSPKCRLGPISEIELKPDMLAQRCGSPPVFVIPFGHTCRPENFAHTPWSRKGCLKLTLRVGRSLRL